VNRREIARAHRRLQAEEALEFERGREAALRDRLAAVVTEEEGRLVDEEAFARMAPEDAALVREGIGDPIGDEEEPESFERDDFLADPDDVDWHEEEIARLQEEIASAQRRQQALERYLEALNA
jgi:hypothetical protein